MDALQLHLYKITILLFYNILSQGNLMSTPYQQCSHLGPYLGVRSLIRTFCSKRSLLGPYLVQKVLIFNYPTQTMLYIYYFLTSLEKLFLNHPSGRLKNNSPLLRHVIVSYYNNMSLVPLSSLVS